MNGIEISQITVNFKMPKEMRDAFKAAAKTHGATMQAILYSMVENYIENADHLKLRIVDSKGGKHE